jgi:hypothetical protein
METRTKETSPNNCVWIFKKSHTVWLASYEAYRLVPVNNGIGESDLKTGIRVPFPIYSECDVIVNEEGRRLIPWTKHAYLDISELNIDKKNRG